MGTRQDVGEAVERGSLSTRSALPGMVAVLPAMQSADLRDVARRMRRAAATCMPGWFADRAPPAPSSLT